MCVSGALPLLQQLLDSTDVELQEAAANAIETLERPFRVHQQLLTYCIYRVTTAFATKASFSVLHTHVCSILSLLHAGTLSDSAVLCNCAVELHKSGTPCPWLAKVHNKKGLVDCRNCAYDAQGFSLQLAFIHNYVVVSMHYCTREEVACSACLYTVLATQ